MKVKELTTDLESAKNEIKACKVEHEGKMSSQKKEQEASLKQKLADLNSQNKKEVNN